MTGEWSIVLLLTLIAAMAGGVAEGLILDRIERRPALIVVYVPEVFPKERRGACIGWSTTVAGISYVLGPVLAAVLLKVSPTMEWFWVAAAGIVLTPIAILTTVKPYETKTKELEDIAVER